MQAAALARGYDLGTLRARQFRAADFNGFDRIIGMDADNLRDIEALRPKGSKTPVVVFTDFATGDADYVPDPCHTRDFNGALDLIENASRGLVSHLKSMG